MKGNHQINHSAWMDIALEMAQNALEAGDFPVGCVIVHKGNVVATGKRENSTIDSNELDHAEIMAMRNLKMAYPEINPEEVILYSTMEPCLMCYATLVVNGVRNIVYGYEDGMGGGTNLDLSRLAPLYSAITMNIIPHIRRKHCLDLFQQFFRNEKSTYLQDSLLARSTLAAK